MIQKIDDCKCDFKNENQSTSTQRVKEAFLRQVSMGVDARKAFLNSLNAIDEKYNPKNDEYICEEYVPKKGKNLAAMPIKKIKLQEIITWIEVIDAMIPVIEKFFNLMDKNKQLPNESTN